MVGIIYVATNRVNGKQYVGLTKRKLQDRWAQHIRVAYSHNRAYFQRALVKYGPEAFDVVWFASVLDISQLSALERAVIQQLSPAYNMTNGGEFTAGKAHSPDVIERIRKLNTGKRRTPEQCERIAQAAKRRHAMRPELAKQCTERLSVYRDRPDVVAKRVAAVGASARNRVWSEASRKKLSASCMGRRYGADIIARMAASKRKAISCSDGNVYDCCETAARATGISKKSIWRVCNGVYPSVKGVSFSYIGDS